MSGVWLERETADGSWTLWDTRLDEGCHSDSGAWQQATQRYADACQLGPRARAEVWSVCRLLDIGTGLGLNLAAALAALAPSGVPLVALTLELESEVIERGLALYERAALACGPWEVWHAPVRRALRAALAAPGSPVALGEETTRGQGTLELRLGDARSTLGPAGCAGGGFDGVLFDAVFLDPFSPRRASALWEEPFLACVAQHMASTAWLSTYSASFRVRLALARAGLRVGRGPRVGAKSEGTLASLAHEPPALPPRLARRLQRRRTTLVGD